MKLDDLTGKTFGKLTAIGRGEDKIFPSGQTGRTWVCKCQCGKEITVLARNLKSGNTKSCGCYALEFRTKHDKWGTKVYKVWDNMRSRCLNPNSTGYKNWGGRGITIYEEWINSFDRFYEYVSKLPHFGEQGYSFDRINVNGNYEPGNVRWATYKEQTENRRKHNGVI